MRGRPGARRMSDGYGVAQRANDWRNAVARAMSPPMSQILFYLAVAACIVVLIVLMVGIGSFAKGGEFNRKYSNKIMRLRILTQAIAIVLIIAAVLAAQMGI